MSGWKMSVANVTSGGRLGYESGKEIWKRRTAGAYGPGKKRSDQFMSWARVKRTVKTRTVTDKDDARPQRRVSWRQRHKDTIRTCLFEARAGGGSSAGDV